ncbi:protein transport protein Sec24A-like [Panonychus citri]|uniref:protein transport protein Sec24A-like n=1 Tax=Panonychus citri TaxID=50023 RepID=UPI002307534F|nr:protein transport protein Sec24A-like [Panonychus citri]
MVQQMAQQFGNMSVQNNWSSLWGQEGVNLLADRNIKTKTVDIVPGQDTRDCNRNVMRSTLQKVPETASLLQKSRLPFGLLIHPFCDYENIPIIQDRTIVRCRNCRTYLNPFVRLLDQRRWQCNVCHRVNDLPDDFLIDPVTHKLINYPLDQPELSHATVEFVASVEYMVRPPQPAAYLFVFDCSAHAFHLGYLPVMADALLSCINSIPGDSRTMIGFIGFDSRIHFFNLGDKKPQHMIMPDIKDVFIPSPESLLVNLQSKRPVIEHFLYKTLKELFSSDGVSHPLVIDSGSAMGSALTAAYEVISSIGGRITVIQATLPNLGPDGSVLTNREDPNNRASNNSNTAQLTPLLNPATDFYKKLALDCSEHHVAVDLFDLSATFSDLATVGQVAKVSGGSVFYYGASGANMATNPGRVLARFSADLVHYLCRNIGFEAVMRLRCTKGLSIHTFHGNFFVRSTDLISLPNCNPDNGYAMQISIDEDFKDFNSVCFQAAVLYTNPVGERRIRVHTLNLPIVANLSDVINSADQEAIAAMLCKMAVDRSLSSSLSDAREAMINAILDLLSTYRNVAPYEASYGLTTSYSTRLLPLYISALLKHTAFRVGISTKIDERVYAMERLKSLPLCHITTYIYPDLYPVHMEFNSFAGEFPKPVQLSFANVDRNGVYLLDTYECIYLYICKSVSHQWLSDVFGVTQWAKIPDDGDYYYDGGDQKMSKTTRYQTNSQQIDSMKLPATPTSISPLPRFENATSMRLNAFINYLISSRPLMPHFFLLREDSRLRYSFLQYMYDDRNESSFSYYEFLQHLQSQLKG